MTVRRNITAATVAGTALALAAREGGGPAAQTTAQGQAVRLLGLFSGSGTVNAGMKPSGPTDRPIEFLSDRWLIPIIALFAVPQKQFFRGVEEGSVKG